MGFQRFPSHGQCFWIAHMDHGMKHQKQLVVSSSSRNSCSFQRTSPIPSCIAEEIEQGITFLRNTTAWNKFIWSYRCGTNAMPSHIPWKPRLSTCPSMPILDVASSAEIVVRIFVHLLKDLRQEDRGYLSLAELELLYGAWFEDGQGTGDLEWEGHSQTQH